MLQSAALSYRNGGKVFLEPTEAKGKEQNILPAQNGLCLDPRWDGVGGGGREEGPSERVCVCVCVCACAWVGDPRASEIRVEWSLQYGISWWTGIDKADFPEISSP